MDIHGLQIRGRKSPIKTHAKEGHKDIAMGSTPTDKPDTNKHHELHHVAGVTDGRCKVML